MIRNNDIIQGYTVLMVANGMVLAHSETAPDPYVVWHTANGNDVYGGKYLPNKEDAEWDFHEGIPVVRGQRPDKRH
ncbi:MAG: hypothetical protein V8T38_00005 [Oscillospiraceae bacterium]